MMIKAILFDLIGTTVMERGTDTVVRCFEKAFEDNQIPFDAEQLRVNRGKDKMAMIKLVLDKADLTNAAAPRIFNAFEEYFLKSLDNFRGNNGFAELMSYLKGRQLKVGLGSGLSRDMFDKVLNHLEWNQNDFDYVGIASEVGKSRPDPAMIIAMMTKLGITNPREFMKVGDTVADIQEGKNAGVITVAILAGTQSKEALEGAGPDFIIGDLSELKGLT